MQIEKYDRYQAAVLGGSVLVCNPVRKAVERQRDDLVRVEREDFPYRFDRDLANRALLFFSLLKCTAGEWKGRPLVLADFQAWRLAVVLGWVRKDDGTRRFRRAYVEVARKNGKTEEAAALMLYGLLFDGEETAQVFSAATTRHQAKIVFNAAKIMLRQLATDSPGIRKRVQMLMHRVVDTGTDSYMEALSSDAWTLDGLSPHLAVIDEYHAHPNNEVLKVLETGMGARRQPLTYIITTAGYNMEGPCYALRGVGLNILDGILSDETFFCVVYTLDAEDDWNDESVWIKANPGIGSTPKWPFMRSEHQKAKNEGKTAERDFLTKNLNIWVRSSTGWVKDADWMACPAVVDWGKMKGLRCWGGIDLASTSDFTALSLFFPGAEGQPHTMRWYLWLPEDTYEARLRAMPVLREWHADGWVETTPGNVMDYDYIEARVLEVSKEYNLQVVGVDPYNSKQLIVKLQQAGVNIQFFSQGLMHMSTPTKEMERMIAKKEINTGGNPVIRWMLGNVATFQDKNANIALHKGKSTEKIDGVIAGIIAIGEWMTTPAPQISYLEEDELIFL